MRQTELKLSKRDRQEVDEFRTKGNSMAREVNRAHILAGLGIGRTAIWRTRAADREAGLEFALHDVARPGKPKRYAGDEEAQVSALACSEPPPGAKRWTVALLTEAARKTPGMRPISRETVRRFLKKTSSNRGAN